ncbi:MAG: hypothetical protein MK001_07370, partial [Alcanivorax sp.]|nr:hypothetical protein [Alcanivorax sp.]
YFYNCPSLFRLYRAHFAFTCSNYLPDSRDNPAGPTTPRLRLPQDGSSLLLHGSQLSLPSTQNGAFSASRPSFSAFLTCSAALLAPN